MMKTMMKHCRQMGYSLVELSVSTSILALLAVGGMAVLQKKTNTDQIRETETKMLVIEKAIESFVDVNGYLPCPAHPMLRESHINFGKSENLDTDGVLFTEASMYDETTGLCSNNGMNDAAYDLNYTGVVPVRTLNIRSDYAYDGWGRKFTYRIADFAGKNGFDDIDFRGNIRIVDLAGNNTTNIDNPPPLNDGAIYVLISHGQNAKDVAWRKNFDYINNTDPQEEPQLATGIERQNTNHNSPVIYIQDKIREDFDDIVVYGSQHIVVPPKIVEAPNEIGQDACTSALAIEENSDILEDFSDNVDSNFAEEIGDTAKKLKKLCDNPPQKLAGKQKPIDLSGLMLWFDATDPFGTGKQLANGDSVDTWYDKSGNNYNAVAPTGARPVYVNDANGIQGINGLPAIKFNGAQHFKVTDEFTPNRDNNITIAAVVKPDSGSSGVLNIFTNGSSASKWNFNIDAVSATNMKFFLENNGSQLVSSKPFTQENESAFMVILSRRQINSSVKQDIYVNGVNVTQNPINGSLDDHEIDSKYIGRNVSNNGFDGLMGELIVLDIGLSEQRRKGLEFYLERKWGMALDINADESSCPYIGQIRRVTETNPTGGCACPEGQRLLLATSDLKDACFADNTEIGRCVPYKSKPKYADEGLTHPNATNLTLWLDANNCSSLELQLDNGKRKVAKWRDNRRSQDMFYSYTPLNSPEYKPNHDNNGLFNKRAYIHFNGTSLLDRTTTTTPSNSEELSIFAVISHHNFDDTQTIIGGNSLLGSNDFLLQYSGNGYSFSTNGNTGTFKENFTESAPYLLTLIYNKNEPSPDDLLKFYVNGIPQSPTTPYTPSPPGSLTTAPDNIGADGGSIADGLNGNIAEILIYEYALDTPQRQAIEDDYLMPKWNISDGLNPAPGGVEAGLLVWFDAKDDSTVFEDTDCSTVLTASGDLGCWESKRSTASFKAKAYSSKPNYKPSDDAVTFNVNSEDELKFSGHGSHFSSAFTFISVITQTGTTGASRYILAEEQNVTDGFGIGFTGSDSNGVFTSYLPNINNVMTFNGLQNIGSGEPFIYTVVRHTTPPGISFYKNGKFYASNLSTIPLELNANSNSMYLGGNDGNTQEFVGNIHEILGYNRNLTAEELQAVHSALSSKWNIELENNQLEIPYSIGKPIHLWLDAADINGNSVNDNPAPNTSVVAWRDKATDSDFTTAANSSAAIIKKQNFKEGVFFNGADAGMQSSIPYNFEEKFTTFIVSTPKDNNANTAGFGPVFSKQGFKTVSLVFEPSSSIFGLYYYDQTAYKIGELSSSTGIGKRVLHTIVVPVSGSGDSLKIYQDGYGGLEIPNVEFDMKSDQIRLGRDTDIMNKYFSGFVHEIIVYYSQLDDTDRNIITKYLGDKWNINVK